VVPASDEHWRITKSDGLLSIMDVIATNRNSVDVLETITHPQLGQSGHAPWLKQLTDNAIRLLETSFEEESFAALPSQSDGCGTAQDTSADDEDVISIVFSISMAA